MSDEERRRAATEQRASDAAAERSEEAASEEEEEEVGSPFDHPAFLPVLLWALAAWFGYDGWFNEDIEAVNFNRYGFGVLVLAGAYYTIQALRERRTQEGDPAREP